MYRVLDLWTGISYIGQTNDLGRRLREHSGKFKEWSVVKVLYKGSRYKQKEAYYVKYYNSYKGGLNLNKGNGWEPRGARYKQGSLVLGDKKCHY